MPMSFLAALDFVAVTKLRASADSPSSAITVLHSSRVLIRKVLVGDKDSRVFNVESQPQSSKLMFWVIGRPLIGRMY